MGRPAVWPTQLQLLGYGFLTRLFVALLGVGSSYLVGPFDSSPTLAINSSATVWSLARLGTHWDSEYFVKIAENGYEYEQFHAFFPLLPMSMRMLKWAGDNVVVLPTSIWGWLLCNSCFIVAVPVFHRLSVKVLGDRNLATKATVLFCCSPATVFFSQVYTESLYMLMSFSGMLLLERSYGSVSNATQVLSWFGAGVFFAIGTTARSNGILQVLYLALCPTPNVFELLWKRPSGWFLRLITIGVMCIIAVSPMLAVLAYGWLLYCGSDKNEPRPWCDKTIPSIYTFVQGEYWDVGLFNYYTVQQIPNFVLAAPILTLSLLAILSWVTKATFNNTKKLLPYMLHLAILVGVSLTTLHVQVATRFICSSSPVVYWYAAHIVTKYIHGWPSSIVLAYFAGYSIVGSILFYNYYPWT